MRPTLLPLTLLAVALAGCGGGDTTTVTETRTVTVTETTAQTPPGTSTTTAAPAAAPAGLAADQVALIGTFDMEVTDANDGGLNASGSSPGTEEEWRLSTTCAGTDCSVQLRRRLQSGGLEIVALRPKDGTPGQWYGEFRSKGQCAADEDIPTDATLTLRGLRAQDRVATKVEAFWRAKDIECTNGKGGVARYTGTLR